MSAWSVIGTLHLHCHHAEREDHFRVFRHSLALAGKPTSGTRRDDDSRGQLIPDRLQQSLRQPDSFVLARELAFPLDADVSVISCVHHDLHHPVIVGVGLIAGMSQRMERRGNWFLVSRADRAIGDGRFGAINVYHLVALLIDFLRGVSLTILFLLVLYLLLPWYGKIFGQKQVLLQDGYLIWTVYGFAIAVGIDLFLNRSMLKRTLSFMLAGIALGSILIWT